MLLPFLFALPMEPQTTLGAVSDEVVSVHSDALRANRHETRVSRAFPQSPAVRSNVQRIVYGYLPYWVTDTSEIRWDLLTHVADFSIDLNSDGSLGAKNGWPDSALVTAAHAAGVKVEPAFTLFSSSSLTTLLTSATNRSKAIDNMIDQMEAGNADGISLDFEGVPAGAKAGLTAFCQELRARLTSRGHPTAGITIAAPAVDWSGAFDIAVLLDSIDVYFIMGYDYFWSGSSMAGPTGIFRTNDTWLPASSWAGLKSVATTAHLAGEAKRKKVVYGVPYYGREYTTSGSTWPSSVSSSVGAKNYNVVRDMMTSGTPTVVDDVICQPAMIFQKTGAWHQLWYEDDKSLACKYDLVLQQELGGTGMWALGADRGYPDLWNLLDKQFSAPAALGMGSKDAPIVIDSFAYSDSRDTSKGGYRYFNFYSCKDTIAEYGREFVYSLDICQPGTVHLQVDAVGGDDPDVHLLSDLKESACLARADVAIDQALTPGRYYVVVDTYVSGGVEQEGPYGFKATFVADPGTQPCPNGTSCSAGTCVCAGGQTLCGSDCRDTATDPSNCGVCGKACNSGDACSAGVCGSAVDGGSDASKDSMPEASAEASAESSSDASKDGSGQEGAVGLDAAGEAVEELGSKSGGWVGAAPQDESGCACSGVSSRPVRTGWLGFGLLMILRVMRGRKSMRAG